MPNPTSGADEGLDLADLEESGQAALFHPVAEMVREWID